MLEKTAQKSAGLYLQRIQELEDALFAYVKALHETGSCGANGKHRIECEALFELLGWDSVEQYLAAIEHHC